MEGKKVNQIKLLENYSKKLENQLEKYKKAVVTRDKVIAQLREEIAGQYEVAQILAVYMGILISDAGGAARISRQEVSENLGKRKFRCRKDGDYYEITVENVE